VHVDEDGLTIQGHRAVALSEVDTHHDHRLAMALSLFALRNEKVVVRDADVVTKSWPSYFEDMKAILTAPNQQK
jgi:3-phosphoshikimate 1-carboxyvinyltransferase